MLLSQLQMWQSMCRLAVAVEARQYWYVVMCAWFQASSPDSAFSSTESVSEYRLRLRSSNQNSPELDTPQENNNNKSPLSSASECTPSECSSDVSLVTRVKRGLRRCQSHNEATPYTGARQCGRYPVREPAMPVLSVVTRSSVNRVTRGMKRSAGHINYCEVSDDDDVVDMPKLRPIHERKRSKRLWYSSIHVASVYTA